MSYIDREVAALLKSLLPKGIERWMEIEEGDGGIGDLLLAMAAEANADGFAVVDRLALEANPHTSVQSLPEHEAAIGVDRSKIAQYGTNAARQAHLVSRWRERGTPTPSRILAAVQALTGPTAAELIETSRSILTAALWYNIPAAYLNYPITASADTEIPIIAADNAPASNAGARFTVRITHPSIEDLYLIMYAPDGTASSRYYFGSGSVTGQDFVFYWPGASGLGISGAWRFVISDGGGAGGTIDDPAGDYINGLSVEGIGRTVFGGPEGLGSAIFDWAIAVNEAVASTATYDRTAVGDTVRRWNPTHTNGRLALYMTGGTLGATYDDPNALFDICVFQ